MRREAGGGALLGTSLLRWLGRSTAGPGPGTVSLCPGDTAIASSVFLVGVTHRTRGPKWPSVGFGGWDVAGSLAFSEEAFPVDWKVGTLVPGPLTPALLHCLRSAPGGARNPALGGHSGVSAAAGDLWPDC